MRAISTLPTQAALAAARSAGRTAFTFIELTIVLAVLAILAAVVIPRFGGGNERQRVRFAAQRIAADVRLARTTAIKKSASQSIIFDESARRYTLPGVRHLDRAAAEYTVELSQEPYAATELKFDLDGDSEIVFDGYGVPDSGGWVRVQRGSYECTVSIEAQLGYPDVGTLAQ